MKKLGLREYLHLLLMDRFTTFASKSKPEISVLRETFFYTQSLKIAPLGQGPG